MYYESLHIHSPFKSAYTTLLNDNKLVPMIGIQLILSLFWATLTTPTTIALGYQNAINTEGILVLHTDDSSPNFPLVFADLDDDSDDDIEGSGNGFSQNFSHYFHIAFVPSFSTYCPSIIYTLRITTVSPNTVIYPVQKRLFILFNRLKLDC